MTIVDRDLLFRGVTLGLFSLLVGACATPVSSGSQCVVEPGYLSEKVLFSWTGDDAVVVYDDTGYVSPLAVDSLEERMIEHLAGKGFEFVDDAANAEFTLSINLSTRRELVSATIDATRDADRWEPVQLSDGARFDLRTVGFLSADAFVDGKPIWRGWVERNLYPKDRDQADLVIGEAVPLLFATFPP